MSNEKNYEAAPPSVHTAAARDVLAERRRQVVAEGWTPEHDDAHAVGAVVALAMDRKRSGLGHDVSLKDGGILAC